MEALLVFSLIFKLFTLTQIRFELRMFLCYQISR